MKCKARKLKGTHFWVWSLICPECKTHDWRMKNGVTWLPEDLAKEHVSRYHKGLT